MGGSLAMPLTFRRANTLFPITEIDMAETPNTQNWPELAIGLYDKLTGRNAEISYSFDEFELNVPSSTAADSPSAHWKMNGTIRIATRDRAADQAS